MTRKVGDKVEVYYDPLTEEELEGTAKLVKLHAGETGYHEGRTIDYWEVKFTDGYKVIRKILGPVSG